MQLNREQRRAAGFVQLDDGSLIERDVLGIVERIRAYDENLNVQYLDPASASGVTEAPYRIIERCRDNEWRVVFAVWTLDETVLQRIYAADSAKLDVLANLSANNMVARMNEQRRYREDMEDMKDKIQHAFASPKTTYSFKDEKFDRLVTVDDSDKRFG